MEAEGARRQRRLDAQHDSAPRQGRETHGSISQTIFGRFSAKTSLAMVNPLSAAGKPA